MFSSVFLTISAMIYLSEVPVSLASEPACSKFSYEEKLLEKMIRTEIKVETMQKEIKKTKESVFNTLVDIEKTAAKTEIKFEEIRNNLTGEVVTQLEDLYNKEGVYILFSLNMYVCKVSTIVIIVSRVLKKTFRQNKNSATELLLTCNVVKI
jgi:2-oxoglutarate dehydrogenase complex dehydrogenase (E1) component-like enzyme